MIIRPYAGLPRLYSPDLGEVVEARKSKINSFTKAVVVVAQRNRDGNLRLRVQWLEDNPAEGIKANTPGWLVVVTGDEGPALVRQIDKR